MALVTGPQFDYCTVYHCAGDCGLPHNQEERAALVAHALATFDALTHDANREAKEKRAEVERLARQRV